LFQKVGLFSESHFRHMDHEFGLRCQAAGARVGYEPSMTVNVPADIQCIDKEYFLRWAFKAGLAIDASECPPRPWRIPLWVYRQWAEDRLGISANSEVISNPAVDFARLMRAQRMWGRILGAWHAWLRPARHEDWVVRHSQKKGNKVF
jgi:hypothetical protein